MSSSAAKSQSRDAKFFRSKKGEIYELKEALDGQKEERKKDAVKKIIAEMTVGKDVSMLFGDVVKCVSTPSIELKKLVYLYVMNYAKIRPDLAILAVGTFVKDADHPNPLIRALALRTMGQIRIEGILDYLLDPLKKAMRDQDPYVRKTAAVCVAKLNDIDANVVKTQGFLDGLRDLLSDANPMVVANAVAALTEIDEHSKAPLFRVDTNNITTLMAAFNECTEWGQIFILNAVAHYTPRDTREAQNICERISPRLQHGNSAVVLATTKVLIRYLDTISDAAFSASLCKRMGPPLVTLMTKEPEMQYVALRNIELVVQKRPSILQNEMRVFFTKYNDPIYVKLEKLEIMIMLANASNIASVLLEFKEYATEIDVEFVRKSVRAIGRCAIKLEAAAEQCIEALLELIQTRVNYVVQEAIVVIKDIFRKYPGRYEKIIATLCENLETLDEPEARAAMVWIVGEYADRIDNADDLLASFLETWRDDSQQVQLNLLTACVKLFLKRPRDTQKLVQQALELATSHSDNPDLRDRGFVYWRLLSFDPESAKRIVLGERPLITEDSHYLDANLVDELVANMSSLASVFHQPPEKFVSKLKALNKPKAFKSADAAMVNEEEGFVGANEETEQLGAMDMRGLETALPGAAGVGGAAGMQSTVPVPVAQKVCVLGAEQGKGLAIMAAFARREGALYLDLQLQNYSAAAMSGFAVQFNRNTFGIVPATVAMQIQQLDPGCMVDYSVPLLLSRVQATEGSASTTVQMAFKNNVDVFYSMAEVPFFIVFEESGLLDKNQFLQMWQGMPDANEHSLTIANAVVTDFQLVSSKLAAQHVFFIASREVNAEKFWYYSCKSVLGSYLLVELKSTAPAAAGTPVQFVSSVKTLHQDLFPLFDAFITQVLTQA